MFNTWKEKISWNFVDDFEKKIVYIFWIKFNLHMSKIVNDFQILFLPCISFANVCTKKKN